MLRAMLYFKITCLIFTGKAISDIDMERPFYDIANTVVIIYYSQNSCTSTYVIAKNFRLIDVQNTICIGPQERSFYDITNRGVIVETVSMHIVL